MHAVVVCVLSVRACEHCGVIRQKTNLFDAVTGRFFFVCRCVWLRSLQMPGDSAYRESCAMLTVLLLKRGPDFKPNDTNSGIRKKSFYGSTPAFDAASVSAQPDETVQVNTCFSLPHDVSRHPHKTDPDNSRPVTANVSSRSSS